MKRRSRYADLLKAIAACAAERAPVARESDRFAELCANERGLRAELQGTEEHRAAQYEWAVRMRAQRAAPRAS